jgi:polyisoprenoid-binding protein YceI
MQPQGKKTMTRLLTLFAIAISLASAASYEIDGAHSTAGFSVRHMMVTNVRGDFTKLSGTVDFDPNDLSKASIRATIDAASINTRNERRDNHLRSADFFDVAKFPTLTFVSKKFAKVADAKYKVTGDLTIHGVTREVVLDVEGPTPEVKAGNSFKTGASASVKINRKDYGLTWNRALEAGGVTVGDEVSITLDIELNRKEAAPTGASSARP